MALSSLLLQDLPNEVRAAGPHMAATWLACPEEEEGGHLQVFDQEVEEGGLQRALLTCRTASSAQPL